MRQSQHNSWTRHKWQNISKWHNQYNIWSRRNWHQMTRQ